MKSPLTQKENVMLERKIPSSIVVEKYKTELGIDVSRFFYETNEISIYKCLDTGYRFYYPFNITGDDSFYQRLEKFSWYYMDSKWEHEIAEKFIQENDKVLEIGCAKGGFLKKIKKNGAIVEGLEMNSDAVDECKKNDLSVYPETIEKFSKNKKDVYDIVCSFQVLEHVPEVKNFLDASLSVLKPGGSLIISVPNNDCFFLKGIDVTLNIPPHHMGLWTTDSLFALEKYFNIRLVAMHLEPLQSYHVTFADAVILPKVREKLSRFGPFGKLFLPFVLRLARLGVWAMSSYIIGHTIIAVFEKRHG